MTLIQEVPFEEAFKSVPVGKLKIKQAEYLPQGKFRVVDQGKSDLIGFSNNEKLARTDGPYILFGDHTKEVKYIDFPFVVGADGVRLYKAKADFRPKFLFYFLKSVSLPSDSYGRHSKYLQDVLVPKFNEAVQRQIENKITAQLTEIEKAREAMEIALKDVNRIEFLVFDHFLSEFKKTKGLKIGEYAKTESGSTPSRGNKNYWEGGTIPWIKTGEIVYKPIITSEEKVTEKALEECSIKLLPENTVLIAMYGQGKTRGQSAILKVPATTNQACFAIHPNETWHPEFLQTWLRYSYQDLRKLSDGRGGNQANLNGSLLNSLEVPAPSMDHQIELVSKISSALNEVSEMKKSWKVKKAEIEALPNRILANAFNKKENGKD